MSKCVQQQSARLGQYSPASTCSSLLESVGGNKESLNSSIASCTSSVSSRWEEMNMISKELHSYAVKNLSISDDLSSLSPLSNKQTTRPTAQPDNNTPPKKSTHLSDLDSTLDLLKNYIDKYKCKSNKPISDSSFEDSVYSNNSNRNQQYNSKYLDTSISSIAPVADENQRTIDDLLSLCSESTLTTNSDELYGKLEHYSDKYLFKFNSPNRRNLDISFTSLESNKENIKPKAKKSKTTNKKSTTPSTSTKKPRPQSVKVSTLKSTKLSSSSNATLEEKKSKKTPKRATTPTPKPISKTVETKKSTPLATPKPKRSSSTSKIPSTTSIKHKIVIPKTPEVPPYASIEEDAEEEELSLPGTPLEPSPNLSSSLLTSSSGGTSFEEIIIHAPNYFPQKDVETKSCQTSMIVEKAQTKIPTEEVPLDDSLTTLGGDDEIAFKIIGATDKIEKVEVYLKNSKGHATENLKAEHPTNTEKVIIQEAPSYSSQAIQVNTQSPKTLYQYISNKDRSNPSSPEHYSSSSYSSSSEDPENALDKLKSIYNRYFIQNHQ